MNPNPGTFIKCITLGFGVVSLFLCVAIGQAQTDSAETLTDSGKRSLPFITLRDQTGNDRPAKFFGGERGSLSSGHCDLSYRSLGNLSSVAEKAPFYLPEEIVRVADIRLSPVEEFWTTLRDSAPGKAPILYAHGFYISFERGCRRASLLRESLALEQPLVLFSWPSDGAILNYTRDESDLFWSVDPLHREVLRMIEVFGEGRVNLVAHSLGTRGVMLALIRLAQVSRANGPLVNQVVLIAPDIDAGIFRQYLPIIRPLARNMTIYVSSKDSALEVSRRVHGYPRLGQAGEHLQDLAGIDIIDMSDIPMRSPSGHVYHLYHNAAVADLSALLRHDHTAAERQNLKRNGENAWSLQSAE